MKRMYWNRMKLVAVGCVVAGLSLAWSTAGAAEDKAGTAALTAKQPVNLKVTFDWPKLNAEALEQYAQPVRAGVKGPYWHEKHDWLRQRFIYAPAFAFKPVTGAACYRYTIMQWDKDLKNRVGERQWVFEADDPQTSLAPVWNDLPVCRDEGSWSGTPLTWLKLTVEGLDGKGGKVIAVAENARKNPSKKRWFMDQDYRVFRRGEPFHGPQDRPKTSMREAALEAIRYSAANEPIFAFYKEHRLPMEGKRGPENAKYSAGSDNDGVLGCLVGAGIFVADSMVLLARETQNPDEAAMALRTARNATETVINCSLPAEWKYAFYPNMLRSLGPLWKGYLTGEKTFEEWLSDTHERDSREYPMYWDCRPGEAGFMYLDMYDLTKEKKYLDAAKRLAQAYGNTQLASGTWYFVALPKTGEPWGVQGGERPPAIQIWFLDRLAGQYGVRDYEKTADRAFQWLLENEVKPFDLRAHYHDAHPAPRGNQGAMHAGDVATCLFNRADRDPRYIAMGEEILRFVEDQFICWEDGGKVVERDDEGGVRLQVGFTGGGLTEAYWRAFKTTGKSLYLAKCLRIADALVPDWIRHKGYGWDAWGFRAGINILEFDAFLKENGLEEYR